MQKIRLFVAVLIGPLVGGAAQAGAAPLFEADEALHITIKAPFKSLFGKMLNQDVYVEGELIVEGQPSLQVRLKPRGKTRRRKDICNFPPLTVNFKKQDVKGTVFAKQDKLKLVTHCQDRKIKYQIYYRQEYHIYKTYNLLTDESFQVRPAMITYVDTEGRRKSVTRFAFFIEDANALAKRIGQKRHKVERLKSDELSSFKASRLAIFQFMISNLDWSSTVGPPGENCCHNSKPYIDEAGVVTPVPYDFDFSGVINAKYATPPQGIKVKNVRARLYRGLCRHSDTVPAAVALINEKYPAITAMYRTSPHLEERDAGRALDYYAGYFRIVNDPASFERKITRKCRG
jgi:hypothetical protein